MIWKLPPISVIFEMVLFMGDWLPFCPLRYIPVLNRAEAVCYEVHAPCCPDYHWVRSYICVLHVHTRKTASTWLHSPLGDTLSFLQFNSHKVGRKGKILWTNLPILCFVQGHFSLSSSASWSYFPFCNINIYIFLTSSYSMARKVTQNVWSCWCTARSSCTLEGKHD